MTAFFLRLCVLTIFMIPALHVNSQLVPPQQEDNIQSISSDYLDKVFSKSNQVGQKLEKKSDRTLHQMKIQELRMRRKLAKVDPVKAKEIFGNAEQKYKELEQRLRGKLPGSYSPSLDTMVSSLKFLQLNYQLIEKTKDAQQKVENALSKAKDLENQFQKAEEIKRFLKERKQFLKEQLNKFGFTRELKRISKQAYYYQQQLEEYKALLKDHKKAERKAIELLSKTKWFKDFMRKNSMLASLFRLPGDPSDPTAQAGLAGLQTRAQVNNLIQQQLAAGGPNAQIQFRQNMQEAQAQLQQLKNKIIPHGGSSDVEVPEGYKPNPGRSKTFLQRIRLGADFQSTRHNRFFPVSSDLGLSLSYMLNANSHFSIGSSFKIGWGSRFNHIRISSQGVSIRGGLDWRIRGNLFIAGNYEQNYFSEIRNIEQLRDYGSWKSSALLGLSKKYKAGKKRGGEVKLLYDFFYNHPPVRTQPLIIRIGYDLNIK